ncbi:MAG: hypothetical protein QCI38_03120 [Candidatus Thermoplasmatota archaeon]|nr:hypothetical protein [Candidatus Thermoplasmatota archaeon]
MKDENRKKLEEMLSKGQEIHSREEDFKNIVSVVIAPVLEEFKEFIASKGHQCRISMGAGVEFFVYKIGTSEGNVLSFCPEGGKVSIKIDGQSRGRVDMESFDAQMVEEHVLAFLHNLF